MVYLLFICRADKTSNLHLFLLLKLLTQAVSFAHSLVCSLSSVLEEKFFSKTFLHFLVICRSEKSIVLILFAVVVFPTPFSVSLFVYNCYWVIITQLKKEEEKEDRIHKEKASNNKNNDGKIRDGPLHVDVRVSMRVRVCESVRVYSSIIQYILITSKRFSLFYLFVEQK